MRRPPDFHVYMPTRTECVTQAAKVEERRAPTDESVRLLMELEEAAREKIESSISVGNNGFECHILVEYDNLSEQRVASAIFKLNGMDMKARVRVSGFEMRGGRTTSDLATALRDEVAKVIANELLSKGWPKEIGRW